MFLYFNSFLDNIIHFNQKKTESPKIHKYTSLFSLFTTHGIILNKLNLKKKNFKKNLLFIKFIRLFFYKVFVNVGDSFLKTPHSLIFKPKNKFFLVFFLGSIKYSFFIYPKKIIFINNKKINRKYQKRIKKKILRQIVKTYNSSI